MILREHPGIAAIEIMTDEGRYVCSSCGEEIVIPLDPSAGAEQSYVEDCPVCCRPHVIRVAFDPDGEPHVQSELDY